jgi:hypothetical protein
MDALDLIITACTEAAEKHRDAEAVRDVVAAGDLAGVAKAVQARPEPWFFTAGPSLTVFVTAGSPGSGSAIHDHGLWGVIACLAGREGSRRYEEADGRPREVGIGRLRAGEVYALPASAIHAVFNCWAEPNLVLHVYGGDFLASPKRVWDPVTGGSFALGLSEPLVPIEAGPGG